MSTSKHGEYMGSTLCCQIRVRYHPIDPQLVNITAANALLPFSLQFLSYLTDFYIGMTSGISLPEIIERERKRPRKTASNSTITRKPFGDQPIKILPIPLFIDYYNHYMGGVDQANQL
jgi:hypothetical protein